MAQQTQSQKGTTAKKRVATVKSVLTGPVEKQPKEQGISPEELHRMIAEEAYRIAEQRDFQGDRAMDDWLQAEAEVNSRFEAKH